MIIYEIDVVDMSGECDETQRHLFLSMEEAEKFRQEEDKKGWAVDHEIRSGGVAIEGKIYERVFHSIDNQPDDIVEWIYEDLDIDMGDNMTGRKFKLILIPLED